MPANRARGEAVLLIDGAERRLCLTLGALAELECAFESVSLRDLGARLQRPSASDLLIVLCALLRDEAMTPQALAKMTIDPAEAARAAAAAIASAFADE
jgi:hypothetical protein